MQFKHICSLLGIVPAEPSAAVIGFDGNNRRVRMPPQHCHFATSPRLVQTLQPVHIHPHLPSSPSWHAYSITVLLLVEFHVSVRRAMPAGGSAMLCGALPSRTAMRARDM